MNEQAKVILDENILGVLATINDDGSPWATPLHVVADSDAVYWFSKNDRTHSLNIERDNRVSLALFSPDESRGPRGVYINGRAELLGDSGRTEAYKLFEQRLGTVPSVFAAASAYKLRIGTLNEQKSTGNCWYFYS
jgi:general stress protein 26